MDFILFLDIPQEQLFQKIFIERYSIKKPGGICTDEYYELMRSCWDFDPEKRPIFSDLHHLIAEYLEILEIAKKNSDLRCKRIKFAVLMKFLRIGVRRGKYQISR